MELRVATFNILCDGLSVNEFFCDRGDTNEFTSWCYREKKISEILGNMFLGTNPAAPTAPTTTSTTAKETPCCIIATQENDHFFKLLRTMREDPRCPRIGGVYGVNCKARNGVISHGTCFRVKAQRLLRACGITDPAVLLDKQGLYCHANDAFRRGDLDRLRVSGCDTVRSYTEECGEEFISEVLCIYSDRSPEDLYLSDDGIGIYYNADLVELVEVSLPGSPTILPSSNDVTCITGVEASVRCLFRIKDSGQDRTRCILFYGAHLKSGESVSDAATRHHQLSYIFNDWQQFIAQREEEFSGAEIIPVFAMDSNSSALYEQSYPPRGSPVRVKEESVPFPGLLSELIEQYGLVDGVREQDNLYSGRNQCLKMRNGQTEQTAKAFQLMFDTIDKILVPAHTKINLNSVNCFGFRPYDSANKEFFAELRADKERRRSLHDDLLRSVRSACVRQSLGPDSLFIQLYPNENAPSDHPPVSIALQLD